MIIGISRESQESSTLVTHRVAGRGSDARLAERRHEPERKPFLAELVQSADDAVVAHHLGVHLQRSAARRERGSHGGLQGGVLVSRRPVAQPSLEMITRTFRSNEAPFERRDDSMLGPAAGWCLPSSSKSCSFCFSQSRRILESRLR